jgi:predicted Zn-dependent protease
LAVKKNSFLNISMKRKRQVAIVFLSFFLLVPCIVLSDNHFLSCVDNQQTANITFNRIESEWPLRGSGDEISQYIQRLGVRLAQSTAQGRMITWRFSIVRDLAANAFSIGGGYVFITDGAINLVQNESELVAILAHEIGHELAGHFCKTTNSNNFFINLFEMLFTLKTEPHQVGVGSLIQIVDPLKEQQADQIALSIVQASGYDPKAMLSLVRRLPANEFTHLLDVTRIQVLERTVNKLSYQSSKNSEEFLLIKHILTVY